MSQNKRKSITVDMGGEKVVWVLDQEVVMTETLEDGSEGKEHKLVVTQEVLDDPETHIREWTRKWADVLDEH